MPLDQPLFFPDPADDETNPARGDVTGVQLSSIDDDTFQAAVNFDDPGLDNQVGIKLTFAGGDGVTYVLFVGLQNGVATFTLEADGVDVDLSMVSDPPTFVSLDEDAAPFDDNDPSTPPDANNDDNDTRVTFNIPVSLIGGDGTVLSSLNSLNGDSPNSQDSDDVEDLDDIAVCFLAGTAISTAQGECPVEELKIGDLVKTAQGKLEPVKWIGRQTLDPKASLHPFRSRPIQIKAGALGEGLPKRDLYTSPDHALLVEGLLVNAGALENGSSIVATQPEETFVYYHVELEQHSLIIAEGSYTESFLPQLQDRNTFDNGDEYEELYPEHNILSLIPMSFPRVSSKRQLPRCVAKRLAEVAETLPQVEEVALA